MATLAQQRDLAKQANVAKQTQILFDFIRSIEKQITDLNREQIFKFSSDIYGDAIGFYSRATEIITTHDALLGRGNRIKKEGEPFDLKDTGDFLNRLYAKVSNGYITFGSTDPKVPLILDNPNILSQDLFGLTDANLNKVIRKYILPFYQLSTRKQLGL